jgi:ribosome-associated protein
MLDLAKRPIMLIVTPHLRIPLREFKFSFARSGGPGGQNVNKVNTKATLRWAVLQSPSLPDDVRGRLLVHLGRRITAEGDLLITSQRFRDAGRNTADCLEKLRRLIAGVAVPPRRRRPTRPTRSSAERRLRHKRQHARTKRNRAPDAEP